MSVLATNAITDAAGGNTATINGQTPTVSNMAGRNRIINGDMRIDQRNNGASGTAIGGYTVDRWAYVASTSSKLTWQQNAGSATPPVGFTNYLGITSSSAYSVPSGEVYEFEQRIEGLNVSDLAWGTASASAVTLSFWVRSSLTGTFGGAITNSAGNRSYPFAYTISSANTWEQKSVTIAGDTTGTWLTTNGVGLILRFSVGAGSSLSGTAGAWAGSSLYSATGATSVVGTNGATFYITGVQLEAGSVATPFCPAGGGSYGTELALCQRYYSKSYDVNVVPGSNAGYANAMQSTGVTSGSGYYGTAKLRFPVNMRSAPTISLWTYNGTAGQWHAGVYGQSETAYSASTGDTNTVGFTVSMSGVTAGFNVGYGAWAASAEL